MTINSLDLKPTIWKLKELINYFNTNLKHLDVSMLTRLNPLGGMSINLFEYLTTFVGNGLVFPSGIWYEDPEKKKLVNVKGQTIYSYHYKAETDEVAKKVMRRHRLIRKPHQCVEKRMFVSETEEQCLS